MANSPAVPCHVIAGALGVGKTTAIIDYLKRHAARQFVAVLVNDFGPVGLDAAIIEGDTPTAADDQTKIVMLPGGCVCCTAAGGLLTAFQQIFQLPRLDRIIVEPSGLAMVGDMVDLLRSLLRQFPIRLRPVITLVDPKNVDRPGFSKVPYFVRMIEAADILVANRCDLAGDDRVARFAEWAAALYPPKLRVIATDHGRLPDEVFDLEMPEPAEEPPATFQQIEREDTTRSKLANPAQPHHSHADHAATSRSGGLVWDAAVRFSLDQVQAFLEQLAKEGFYDGDGDGGVPVARLKAILHTENGWRLLEIACGDVFCRATDYRRDNRIDWITTERPLDADAFRQRLESFRLA